MRVSVGYAKCDLCCVRSQYEVKSEEVWVGCWNMAKAIEDSRHKSIPCMIHAEIGCE